MGVMSCDGTDAPWISPTTWLSFLVENRLWPWLAGCAVHDYVGAGRNWQTFWDNYRQLYPSFELFALDGVDYSRCAAFFIHGDEGRTLKRGGILVTSLQSALGRGFDEKRIKLDDSAEPLRVNFAGHFFTTRLLVSAIPTQLMMFNQNFFMMQLIALQSLARNCLTRELLTLHGARHSGLSSLE